MADSYKGYLIKVRDALVEALCLRNFPSQKYEKINRPMVEVEESKELILEPIVITANKEDEKVEIERSINSVRVNIAIKKFSELETLLTGIYSSFLMNRANELDILRKTPKPGYDVSFLITNYTLENFKKEEIIDIILEFVQDFPKEITDMKLTVNSQSRFATATIMKKVTL